MIKHCAFILLLFTMLACGADRVVPEVSTDTDLSNLNESTYPKSTLFAQHLIVELTPQDLDNHDSLVAWICDFQPGGLSFKDWPAEEVQSLSICLDSFDLIKPFFMADFSQGFGFDHYPLFEANSDLMSDNYLKYFRNLGSSWVTFNSVHTQAPQTIGWFDYLSKKRLFRPIYHFELNGGEDVQWLNLKQLLASSDRIIKIDFNTTNGLPVARLKRLLNHKGMVIVDTQVNPIQQLNAGADLVVVHNRSDIQMADWKPSHKSLKKVKSFIEQKKRQYRPQRRLSVQALKRFNQYNFEVKTTAILSDESDLLPLKQLRVRTWKDYVAHGLPSKQKTYVVPLPKKLDSVLWDSIVKMRESQKILFVFSNPDQYAFLKGVPNLCFRATPLNQKDELFVEQLKGHLTINGDLIVNGQRVKGVSLAGQGLARTSPELVGVDRNKMSVIHTYVDRAIRGKAFPGCQILAVKNGVVIYDRSFGTTDYKAAHPVKQTHLYDLASLTKVVSTTLVGMKLFEMGAYQLNDSIGEFLPDSLSEFLPNGSTIENITFQELFVHKSGLPAGFPIIDYMRAAADDDQRYVGRYCDYEFDEYTVKVADALFLDRVYQDSMWLKLNSMWLDPEKPYKYSDVNMNLLYFLFKGILAKSPEKFELPRQFEGDYFELFLKTEFYEPLGMRASGFNPLRRFEPARLVPTEHDRFWRKQLLQGHVHDPNAALHGGIAGNAGVFSNTNELILLLSMFLNEGHFKGERYLASETIRRFISTQPESHRGLGFNKRTLTNAAYAMSDLADVSTYGHTGFTGTCFWVDPVNDLIYIFLSNRVHPKVSNKIYEFNIRKNIHRVFYDASMI